MKSELIAFILIILALLFGMGANAFTLSTDCAEVCNQILPWEYAKCNIDRLLCQTFAGSFEISYWVTMIISMSLFVLAWYYYNKSR